MDFLRSRGSYRALSCVGKGLVVREKGRVVDTGGLGWQKDINALQAIVNLLLRIDIIFLVLKRVASRHRLEVLLIIRLRVRFSNGNDVLGGLIAAALRGVVLGFLMGPVHFSWVV